MDPKVWCGCCGGSGKTNHVEYLLSFNKDMQTISLGEKNCPGCDGSGVSIKAQEYRDKLK